MPQAIGLAIGGFLFNIGAPLALVNFFAIGAGGALALSAGLLGASLLFTPRPSTPASPKPSDGQQAIRQPVPPRWKHFGRVRVTGPVWMHEADTANGILHYGFAINHGEIDAYEEFYIDENFVEIDVDGDVTTAPYNGVLTQILLHYGTDPEENWDILTSLFPGQTEMRGDGVATVLCRFDNFANADDQFENYPNGEPHFRTTIRASKVWDWRDPAQDRLDRTTWGWSQNEVVCRVNWLMDTDAGLGVPWELLEPNLDEYTVEADYCDGLVVSPAAQGSEMRYALALTYLLTEKPADVLSRMESASDGRTWQKRDGTIGILSGRFIQPTVTVPFNFIIRYELTRGQDRLTSVGGVKAQYLSTILDYREQDAEPWPTGDAVLDLDDERVANVDLTMVPSYGQTRRLMKRTYKRATGAWRGTIVTNLFGIKCLDQRYITVQIPELDINESFEVGKISLDLGSNEVTIEIAAVDASIDDWDPLTEERDPPTVLNDGLSHTFLGISRHGAALPTGTVTFTCAEGGLLLVGVTSVGADGNPKDISQMECDGAPMTLYTHNGNSSFACAMAGAVVDAGTHTITIHYTGTGVVFADCVAWLVTDYQSIEAYDAYSFQSSPQAQNITATMDIPAIATAFYVAAVQSGGLGLNWSSATEEIDQADSGGFNWYISAAYKFSNTLLEDWQETVDWGTSSNPQPKSIAAVSLR